MRVPPAHNHARDVEAVLAIASAGFASFLLPGVLAGDTSLVVSCRCQRICKVVCCSLCRSLRGAAAAVFQGQSQSLKLWAQFGHSDWPCPNAGVRPAPELRMLRARHAVDVSQDNG